MKNTEDRPGRSNGRRAGYVITPATPEDVAWIAGLQAETYSAGDAIPERLLKEWYDANPTGFSVIGRPGGERIGHIDILPLRPGVLSAFLEGKVVEKEIRGASLYTPEERGLIRDLYVESLIIRPEEGRSPGAAGARLLNGFPTLIERLCDPLNLRHIYAIAATIKGERLLRRLGFERIKEGRARADHYDVFAKSFTGAAQDNRRP
jgi:hypothetical protein